MMSNGNRKPLWESLSAKKQAVLWFRHVCETGRQPDSDGQVSLFLNAWGEQPARDLVAELVSAGLLADGTPPRLTPQGRELASWWDNTRPRSLAVLRPRLRDRYLRRIYERWGSRYGRLNDIGRAAAYEIGLDEAEWHHAFLHLKEKGYLRQTTNTFDGQLTPLGTEEAERIIRNEDSMEPASESQAGPQADADVGIKTIGEWRLIKQLRKSGQAQSYVARRVTAPGDPKLFVIKVIERQTDPHFDRRRERLRKEIAALKKLSHEFVLPLVDSQLEGDEIFLVTPFCSGGELTRQAVERLSPRERFILLAQIAQGLGHAHASGIVHRDVKPENILIGSEGQGIVADFGICLPDDEDRLTLTSEVVGPRFCTAPELEAGGAADVQATADVYCLGKLAYWLFAFKKLTREDHRKAHYDLNEQLPPEVYTHLYALLDRTVAVDPSARLRNGNEVAEMAKKAAESLEAGGRATDLRVKQRCLWCGTGRYSVAVEPGVEYRDGRKDALQASGISEIGRNWILMYCDQCGHEQRFNLSRSVQPQRTWRGET